VPCSDTRLLNQIEVAGAEGVHIDISAKNSRTLGEMKIWRYIAKRPHFTTANFEAVSPLDPIMRTDFCTGFAGSPAFASKFTWCSNRATSLTQKCNERP